MKNRLFGSTLIIAGTAIGAGMLALPLAAANLGFGTAAVLMILLWALMVYTALLMVEVHQFNPPETTLKTLAFKLLGNKGQFVATFAMMFLLYALCGAYIAGGGEQLHGKLIDFFDVNLPIQLSAIIFAILIAVVVTIGTHSVDIINRVLFGLKMVALIVLLTMLFPNIKTGYLLDMPLGQGVVVSALPVIFTAFGFHGSIASVVRYVGGDTKTLRKVMIFGSTLPLIIFLLWQLVSLGSLTQTDLLSSKLSDFIANLSALLHNSTVKYAASIFTDLAITTSFLGVSLGLFEFMGDMLKRNNSVSHRTQTALITFLPPLGFALFYPDGFIMALGFASIALVVLALFLPVAMVWQQRKQVYTDTDYKVKGGKFVLLLIILSGCLIIGSQLLQTAGLLPKIG